LDLPLRETPISVVGPARQRVQTLLDNGQRLQLQTRNAKADAWETEKRGCTVFLNDRSPHPCQEMTKRWCFLAARHWALSVKSE
jgi:hypothetical protein